MAFEGLNDLYREVILDHFQHPRHHERVSPCDVEQEGYNPLCGDQIILQLKIDDQKISKIGFLGKGCSISQASASILTEETVGRSLSEIDHKVSFLKEVMLGKKEIGTEEVGDMEALAGVKKFPVRIKCALLAWTTLQEALDFYKKRQGETP